MVERGQRPFLALTERQLLVNARSDDVGVDDKTVGDVVQGQKNGVGEQELQDISTMLRVL